MRATTLLATSLVASTGCGERRHDRVFRQVVDEEFVQPAPSTDADVLLVVTDLSAFADRLPADGDTVEQGLDAALHALSPEMTAPGAPHEGLARPDAHLLVVFLSTREDESETWPDRWLVDLDRDDRFAVAAAVGWKGTCEESPGHRYSEVARRSDGLVAEVCDGLDATRLGQLAVGTRTAFP